MEEWGSGHEDEQRMFNLSSVRLLSTTPSLLDFLKWPLRGDGDAFYRRSESERSY